MEIGGMRAMVLNPVGGFIRSWHGQSSRAGGDPQRRSAAEASRPPIMRVLRPGGGPGPGGRPDEVRPAHAHHAALAGQRDGPVRLCRRRGVIGLDGVVITEHDWLWTESELDALREMHPNLVILSGIEVSAREGHFLVYGVTNPFAVPRGIRVADLCHEVHAQGGAVVAAHPFRWGQPFDEILEREKPDLDGLELMTNNMDADCRRRAAAVQARLPLAGLGSSDAHHEDTLGVCYTEFPDGTRTITDLVPAIRGRQTSAHERDAVRRGRRAVRQALHDPTLFCVGLRPEAAAALRAGRPVVALESTLIAHGLPWPINLETARAAEAAVRAGRGRARHRRRVEGPANRRPDRRRAGRTGPGRRTCARPAAATWPPPWRRARRPRRPSPPRWPWPTAPESASSPPAASAASTPSPGFRGARRRGPRRVRRPDRTGPHPGRRGLRRGQEHPRPGRHAGSAGD